MQRSVILALMILAFSWSLAQNNPFVGVWQAQYNDPNFGPVSVEMVFQPNGLYSQTTRTYSSLIYIPGSYGVVQRGLLRLVIDQRNVYPKETCGPLGCDPIRYPEGETHNYSFPNANTLVMHLAMCAPDQCIITYRRVK